jgi:hypothetical protein
MCGATGRRAGALQGERKANEASEKGSQAECIARSVWEKVCQYLFLQTQSFRHPVAHTDFDVECLEMIIRHKGESLQIDLLQARHDVRFNCVSLVCCATNNERKIVESRDICFHTSCRRGAGCRAPLAREVGSPIGMRMETGQCVV